MLRCQSVTPSCDLHACLTRRGASRTSSTRALVASGVAFSGAGGSDSVQFSRQLRSVGGLLAGFERDDQLLNIDFCSFVMLLKCERHFQYLLNLALS